MLKHRYIRIVFIVALLSLMGATYVFSLSMAWWFAPVVLFVGMCSWGAFDLRLNYFAKAGNCNARETRKRIALTFDDGPTIYTSQVLDLLKKHRVQATFFCIGKQADLHPKWLEQIHLDGHSIGNHTYNHSGKTGFLNSKQMLIELVQTDAVIQEITRCKPHLFRPPFGVTNPSIAKALKLSSHQLIGWSIRSLDTAIQSEDRIFKRVISKLKPGAIILLHDTSAKSVRVLERLLIYLEQQQYQAVTVCDLLEIAPCSCHSRINP